VFPAFATLLGKILGKIQGLFDLKTP
jgi:hypothetical protein